MIKKREGNNLHLILLALESRRHCLPGSKGGKKKARHTTYLIANISTLYKTKKREEKREDSTGAIYYRSYPRESRETNDLELD